MGVDYTANYGIGYEVKVDPEIDYFRDHLDDALQDSPYLYFSVGNDFTGENKSFYVIIPQPFASGIDGLKYKQRALEAFLEDVGLVTVGEFGVVGGLLIS